MGVTAVRMGDVWDRTVEVLSGRGGVLYGLAAATMFGPSVLRQAYLAYAPKGSTGVVVIGGLLTLIVFVVAIWGKLAIIAASTDAATTRAGAQARATARLPAALGVTLAMAAVVLLLTVPIGVALAGAGVDWPAMAADGARMPYIAPGRMAFIGLYGFALFVVALFVAPRLALVNPVVLSERRGIGAIARSWGLTRGRAGRILGVMILFVIVVGVSVIAAQAVSGLVLRLILGADAVVTVGFLAGAVATAVSTAFSAIATVFVAQLYVATAAAVPAGGRPAAS